MAISNSDIIAANNFALAKTEFISKTVETFQAKVGLWDMIEKNPIRGVKTHSEIVLGPSGDAGQHTPGTLLTGSSLDDKTRTIALEDIETLHNFQTTMPEMVTDHTDKFMQLASHAGKALRQTTEKHCFQQLILGARTAASGVFPGGAQKTVGGTTVAAAFPKSVAGSELIQEQLSLFRTNMNETNVETDADDLFVFLSPYLLSVLTKDNTLMSRDFVDPSISNLVNRKMTKVEGFWVMDSNLLPNTDLSAATAPTVNGTVVYKGDFSKTAFVALKAGAIGAVHTAMDSWTKFADEYRLWNIGAGFFKGLATRRPEYCCECVISGV